MLTRVLVGITGAIFVISLILFAPAWAIAIAMSICSALASFELTSGIKAVKSRLLIGLAVVSSALFPISIYLGRYDELLGIGSIFFILALFAVLLTQHEKTSFTEVAVAFFAGFALPHCFTSLYRLYLMEYGVFLIMVPLVAAWMSDTMALFSGLLFGKHKLAPVISPKKTIEGSIGGVFGGIIGMLIYTALIKYFFGVEFSLVATCIIGALGAVTGQLGDLIFSVIKRQHGVKDYGKTIPGHGGILDRFDSIILAAPVVEILLYYVTFIK